MFVINVEGLPPIKGNVLIVTRGKIIVDGMEVVPPDTKLDVSITGFVGDVQVDSKTGDVVAKSVGGNK